MEYREKTLPAFDSLFLITYTCTYLHKQTSGLPVVILNTLNKYSIIKLRIGAFGLYDYIYFQWIMDKSENLQMRDFGITNGIFKTSPEF